MFNRKHWQNRLWLGCLAVWLSACQGAAVDAPPLTTVPVNLERYLGQWHQVAHIPNRFQAKCQANTTANYRMEQGKIEVLNRCQKANGEWLSVKGSAYVVENTNNSQLRVSFFWPFYGNYWVLALGDDYQWALVGEPSREYGWILARTPSLPKEQIDRIIAQAAEKGYAPSAWKVD